jgi:hypothetical protein
MTRPDDTHCMMVLQLVVVKEDVMMMMMVVKVLYVYMIHSCLQSHSCILNTALCRDELYTRDVP